MPRDGMDGDGMGNDLDAVFSDLTDGNIQDEINEVRDGQIEQVQELQPQEVEKPPVEAPVIEAPVQEDKSVPLATFLDMRDKLKEAERRANELEAAKPKVERAAPDPFDDPQAYAAYQRQEVQEAVMGQKFEMSDLIARQSHGDETVEAATAWAMARAQSNPAFAAEYMKERHPIDWIVRQHKRDSLMQQVGEDPDEFVRRRAVELGLTAPAPVAPVVTATQQPASTPKAPPKSLVNAPAHGGVSEVATGKLAGLDAVFPG